MMKPLYYFPLIYLLLFLMLFPFNVGEYLSRIYITVIIQGLVLLTTIAFRSKKFLYLAMLWCYTILLYSKIFYFEHVIRDSRLYLLNLTIPIGNIRILPVTIVLCILTYNLVLKKKIVE